VKKKAMYKNEEEIITILLDTNALMTLSLFIEFCDMAGVDPDDFRSAVDFDQAVGKIAKEKDIEEEFLLSKEDKGGPFQGSKVFKYLREENPKEVLISKICENEALHVLLERRADEILTRAGVPFRLRKKTFFRVQTELDYPNIRKQWEDFISTLEGYGIELKFAEEGYSQDKGVFWRDLFALQQRLMEYILIESQDFLIYATAILIGADEIYTSDRELKSIVNSIYNPSNDKWKQTREGIEKELINAIPSRAEESRTTSKLVLPQGVP